MYRKLGYLAAGVVVGLVVTGYLMNKEIREQNENAEEVREDGLFAEVQGNTVRLYKVENGSADIRRPASSRARRRPSSG